MFKITNEIVRTVKVVRDYEETPRSGKNGDFTARKIGAIVAKGSGDKSEFIYVNFQGGLAEVFNKYCNQHRYNENGELVLASRRIQISGVISSYKDAKDLDANGRPIKKWTVEATQLDFIDKQPTDTVEVNEVNTDAVVAQPTMVPQMVPQMAPQMVPQMMTQPAMVPQMVQQTVPQVVPQMVPQIVPQMVAQPVTDAPFN